MDFCRTSEPGSPVPLRGSARLWRGPWQQTARGWCCLAATKRALAEVAARLRGGVGAAVRDDRLCCPPRCGRQAGTGPAGLICWSTTPVFPSAVCARNRLCGVRPDHRGRSACADRADSGPPARMAERGSRTDRDDFQYRRQGRRADAHCLLRRQIRDCRLCRRVAGRSRAPRTEGSQHLPRLGRAPMSRATR